MTHMHALEPNDELNVGTSDYILYLEVEKLGRKAELLYDASVLASGQLGL